MVVAVPVFFVAMPWLVEVVFGDEYAGAVDAARIVLLAAAIQFAIGWTKSLPVTIGRPQLRIVTHGLETLVAIPLVAVLGAEWGATGAAVAVLASTVVFAAAWGVALSRLRSDGRRRPDAARARDGAVRVLVVSGIWPPDPGGPASHAPALAAFLLERGHGVEVVTTALSAPAPREHPVHWVPRSSPLRHARAARLVRSRAARSDVVYATSMIRRAALGASLARRPLVVKLVSDEAFERARRSGRFEGTLDEFQHVGGARVRFLRSTRDAALRRARHVFCPSAYLRGLALGWGLDPERVSVLPNPRRRCRSSPRVMRCAPSSRSTAGCSRSRAGSGRRSRSTSRSRRSRPFRA